MPYRYDTPEFYIDGFFAWLESRRYDDLPTVFSRAGFSLDGMTVPLKFSGMECIVRLSPKQQNIAQSDWENGWLASRDQDLFADRDYSEVDPRA